MVDHCSITTSSRKAILNMARDQGRGGRGRGRGGGGGGGRGRGRGGGGGGGGRRGRGGGGGGGAYADNRVSFDDMKKTNEKMERYYNTLNIVPEGPEREQFWSALRRELPNSWRFTGSKGHALSVRNNLVERFFPVISQIKHEGKPVELPTSMPWYPEGLAYSMTTPKHVVRKYEPFKEFQKFLVSETGVGNISRQEQVSMIPPLMMGIKPEHTVLDLCAAPGSKSAQLIEAIHAGEEDRVDAAITKVKSGGASDGENGRSTGLLVANDVNYQRAQMLIHQVKRLNSPNLIVTNHDATLFPSIALPAAPGSKSTSQQYLKFDRVLADVPCSGDGTCRKNPGIWKDWSSQNALGLYITQVRILTRALQMLKVGGRVVYSTCSMNPMEDEAIVSSAIERCGGIEKCKLIDCSTELPGLIRSPGLTDWSIMSRGGQIYESWAEAEGLEPEGTKIVPGMFPPEKEEDIPLQHCMRVYPHQQDTGGFFIAVIEKLKEIKAKPENESKSQNRNWKFGGLREDDAAAGSTEETAFSEILNDIATDTVDSNGHLLNMTSEVVAQGNGDVSAAARQNAEEQEKSNGVKRKAGDDEDVIANTDTALKRPKFGDEPADMVDTANTTRREHWPLPPSVAQAVEAAGSKPGAEVTEDIGQVEVPEQTSTDATPVVAAARNAPFTPSVPASIKAAEEPPRKRRRDDPTEEAFKYLSPTHPELESIYAFYSLHASFPRDRFLVRNPAGDPVKGIYYSSQLVKEVLLANEGRGMKFVHAGVKMFMKQDAQGQDICRWRIQTEGLGIVEGWVGEERVVRLHSKITLRKLLVEMFPKVGKDADGTGPGGWRELGEIGERVRDIGMGCCVLRVDASEGEDGFAEPITLPLWRSLHSLNLMLPKEERRAMLLRIYDEDVVLVNNMDPALRAANKEGGAKAQAEESEKADGSVQAEKTNGGEGKDVAKDDAVEGDENANDAIEENGGVEI